MTESIATAPVAWTTAQDVKAQLNRLWERGDLLRHFIGNETVFPMRLALKGPTSSELVDHFEAARSWIAAVLAIAKIRIESREFTHRILGLQRVPQSIWVDNVENAIALIGKCSEATRFKRLLELTRSRHAPLVEWLGRRPLQALELSDDWERLLAVVEWLLHHPRPGIYLRQVDIPGVDSKFIEKHRGVLTELFDLTLPPQAIDASRSGASQFVARYGFLDKPTRIRCRLLDSRIALLPGPRLPDIAVDADSFAKLEAPIHRVFITENETNFLAFPPTPNSIVVFGAGYGWDALGKARWLAGCTLHYWGDIDTHGFAILDQLRSRFDHVESFLMDRKTLMAHEYLWGEEAAQFVDDLPRLTEAERTLFDELRDNRIRKNLRLEQERVGFQWVTSTLRAI